MEQVKEEIRIIGIDDFPFEKNNKKEEVRVIGCIFRGKKSIDGVIATKVEKDGNNATQRLIEMIRNSDHFDQLQVIMLDGIALAGFNVVNIQRLSQATGLDCIVVMKRRPDLEATKNALKNNFSDGKRRVGLIEKAGEVYQMKNHGESTFYQKSPSISKSKAEEVIGVSTLRGTIPEPVRVAHLICHGLGVAGC